MLDWRPIRAYLVTMNLTTYILPAYWASFLINGDTSGLSDKEQKACLLFLTTHGLNAARFVSCGESYLASHNDANSLAGDVCEFTYDQPAAPQITDTQRLEFALQNGMLVQGVTSSRFSYNPMSPMNPTRADIDRAIRSWK